MILAAARKGLPDEIERRVAALTISADPAFRLDEKGQIIWRDSFVGRLVRADNLYAPRAEVGDSDLLSTDQKDRMADRLNQFITDHVNTILSPLVALSNLISCSLLKRSEAVANSATEKTETPAPDDQPAAEDKTPVQALRNRASSLVRPRGCSGRFTKVWARLNAAY